MFDYLINQDVEFDCGFDFCIHDLMSAIHQTNATLLGLPHSFFASIDYKTTSAAVGCILCQNIANISKGAAIVNPIEKGHPDVVPYYAAGCTEEELRNYPEGLEVKCTIGTVPKGSNISKASPRIAYTSSISWQAHHQEVDELLGITYDYTHTNDGYKPIITAAFYSSDLTTDDWGNISGTTGRNTKVCGMKRSGIDKMGKGWLAILNNSDYITVYKHIFNI